MSKSKKEKKEESAARGRGRPANFPGIKTISRLYKLPEETVGMVEKMAENRELPIGVVLDAMIRQAFADANRKRTQPAKKADEPAAVETPAA